MLVVDKGRCLLLSGKRGLAYFHVNMMAIVLPNLHLSFHVILQPSFAATLFGVCPVTPVNSGLYTWVSDRPQPLRQSVRAFVAFPGPRAPPKPPPWNPPKSPGGAAGPIPLR